MQHKGVQLIIVYINHDLGLTLNYFTALSNLVTWAFQWENIKKKSDFSKRSVTFDLKAGRYRQLTELMK